MFVYLCICVFVCLYLFVLKIEFKAGSTFVVAGKAALTIGDTHGGK